MITLHVGGCGVRVGEALWAQLGREHGVDCDGVYKGSSDAQLARIGAFYSEGLSGAYTPRTVLADLDGAALDGARASHSLLLGPEAFVGGAGGTGGNYATGYLVRGPEVLDALMDAVRREAEAACTLEGLLVTLGVGGGTGAGLGALALEALRDAFPSTVIAGVPVCPAATADGVVEPYNAVLALHALLEHATLVVPLDNGCLHRRCAAAAPAFGAVNAQAADALCGLTAPLRFAGRLNTSLRKLATNVVPFPRLPFVALAATPLPAASGAREAVMQTCTNLFDAPHALMDCDLRRGRMLAGCAVFRGLVAAAEVDECLDAVKQRHHACFVDWIPDSFQVALCDAPSPLAPLAAVLAANTSASREPLDVQLKRYRRMLARRAFWHSFEAEGLTLDAMHEAEAALLDVVVQYQEVHDSAGVRPAAAVVPALEELDTF